jgi:hypothetical protein
MASSLREGGTMMRFEVLNPGSTSGEKVTFEAFALTLSDNVGAQWDSTPDAGRADSRVRYSRFSRSISVGFKLVALQRNGENSIRDNIEKLNILAKAAYPHYGDGIGFTGRFLKFTIGKLWVAEYGYLMNGINVSYPDDSPWEVDATGGTRPYILDVSISIGWLGNKRPDASKTPLLYDKF